MGWEGKILEVFLSSPSDLLEERKLVTVTVQEWNQRHGRSQRCMFHLLTWENSVTSELENDGQSSINSQIGDEYDLILGLMWGRFGTPTPRAGSGTEEEFTRALQRKNDGDPVRISFFFKTADVPFGDIDPDQIKKVREFKESFRRLGGLSRDFSDPDQLRSQINLLLDQVARDKDRYSHFAQSSQTGAPSSEGDSMAHRKAAAIPLLPNTEEQPEEMGMLDITERFSELVETFNGEVTEWTAETVKLGDAASSATEEMESLARFGSPPTSEVRKVMDRITESLKAHAIYAEEKVPVIVERLREVGSLIDARLILLEDFEFPPEAAETEFVALIGFRNALGRAEESTSELMKTIRTLPRMTSRFNAARRRVVDAHQPFLAQLRNSSDTLERATHVLEKYASARETRG